MFIMHMKRILKKRPQHSAEFPIVLHELILLSSFVRRVQTTRDTMMYFSLINFVINLLCLNYVYCYGYLDSFMHIMHMKHILSKSSRNSAEFPIVLHDRIPLDSVVCRVQTTRCTVM